MCCLQKLTYAVAMPAEALLCKSSSSAVRTLDVVCWTAQSSVPKSEPPIEPVLSFTPPGKNLLVSPFRAVELEEERSTSPSAAQADERRGDDNQADSR